MSKPTQFGRGLQCGVAVVADAIRNTLSSETEVEPTDYEIVNAVLAEIIALGDEATSNAAALLLHGREMKAGLDALNL